VAKSIPNQLLKVFDGSKEPHVVLMKLMFTALIERVPTEQMLEIASNPVLVQSASRKSCEILASLLRKAANEPGNVATLLAAAIERHARTLLKCDRNEESLFLYEAVLTIMERRGPPELLAIASVSRATILLNLRRYSETLIALDTTLPLILKQGSTVSVAGSYMIRGNALQGLSRYAEAVADYDRALPIFQQHAFTADVARCHLQKANALLALGSYGESLTEYDTALPFLQQDGLTDDAARCQINRAIALAGLGRYSEALAGYDTALPLLRRQGLTEHIAGCLMNRANTLRDIGRFLEAVADSESAISLYQQCDLPAHLARCQVGRAETLHILGRYVESLAEFDAALPLLRQHGLTADVAICLMNRANTLQGMGRDVEALEGFDAALPLLQQHGRLKDVLGCLMNRANSLQNLGRYAEAIAEYDAALPRLRQNGLPAEAIHCQMNRAIVLQRLGRFAEAVDSYEQVDQILLRNDAELEKFHWALGYASMQLGEADKALCSFTRARQALRQARRRGRIDETNLEFIADGNRPIDSAVRLALELSRQEEAFSALQDAKGSILGDLRRRLNGSRDESPEIGTARRRLVQYLRESLTLDEEERRSELKQYTDAYVRVWGQCWHSYQPELPEGFAADDPVPLDQIQAALPTDWALLDFWRAGTDEVWAFMVYRDGLQTKSLPFPITAKKSLAGKINRLLASIANLQREDRYDEGLDELDAYLFAPLRPLLQERNIKGLYLVPHDLLHSLPLHASRRREKGKTVYLCDEFAVAYLPSAALLPQLPSLQPGAPVFSLTNPEQGTEHTLPFSGWEGRELQRRLSETAGQFYTGHQAIFERTAGWSDAGLLHFGCHGFGDPSFAPRSHLRLADDLLLAHDVVYRRPPLRDGALVILNGCQTAVRDWRAVDEGMGLMSAFLLRGASLVLATQWSVHDHCAAEMVLTFVEEVRKGTSPTEALRCAQARVRSMTAEEILARHDEVERLFPEKDFPHEAGMLLVSKAWFCRRAGLDREAVDCAERAVASLRQAGLGAEADRLLALTRSAGHVVPVQPRINTFDHPVFWSAFQLVGRVT
jgi:CHAT domain-containing protein